VEINDPTHLTAFERERERERDGGRDNREGHEVIKQ
jgi:hypothetical protein